MIIEGRAYLKAQDIKISKQGKQWNFFHIQDSKANIVKILCFGATSKRAITEITDKVASDGERIIVDGKEGDEKEGIKSFLASSFSFKDPKKNQKKINYNKSVLQKDDEGWHRYRKMMLHRGIIWADDGQGNNWYRMHDCILVDGKWHHGINWIIKILGQEQVSEALNRHRITKLFKHQELYKIAFDDLLTEAKKKTNAHIQKIPWKQVRSEEGSV